MAQQVNSSSAMRYRIHGIPVQFEETYTKFYEKNWPIIHKFFIHDLKDYHEAEDVTQEIMLNVWKFLFNRKESVSHLSQEAKDNLTYQVKNLIWSYRANRQTMRDRRIDLLTESMLFTNDNSDETPLEQAINRSGSVGDPFTESRVYYFLEDLKETMGATSHMFTLIFLGFSHDDIQEKLGISHGTFYRRYKEHTELFNSVVQKHFESGETSDDS